MMMMAYPSEPQGQGPSGAVIEALPQWQEDGELGDHRQYIFHYHTMMCPQFANGYCPRHKGSRAAPPQCFCYHFESQRRRPLVDTLSGRLRYWDVLCDHISENEECPFGDLCPYAHTREEISYHAAKYKTKFCNNQDCRGEEVCCFAHGDGELRTQALERYSYWSVIGSAVGSPSLQGMGSDLAYMAQQGINGRQNSTGALYHPKVYKHRFCASYPHVASCRRGDACAFAHNREEIRTPLLAEEEEEQRAVALTNDFFMHRFKTLWCPVGVQHDWQTCVYAHNYQDARRHPSIGYGPRPCPYWKRKETALEYSQRCPLGVGCPFSHGAKEQLYHPTYFKTVTCQDWPNSNCPRGALCAFWHKRSQQRARPSDDEFNYKQAIPEKKLQEGLQIDFLSPPFKLLNSLQADPQALAALEGWADMGNGDYGPMDYGMMGDGTWWPPAICGPCQGGAGTPTTPTTAADDEAASADSSSDKYDKYPSGSPQDEENANMGQWAQWQHDAMMGNYGSMDGGCGGQVMWVQVPQPGMQQALPAPQEGDGSSQDGAAKANSKEGEAPTQEMMMQQQYIMGPPMQYGMNGTFDGTYNGEMGYPGYVPGYSGAVAYGGMGPQMIMDMNNGFRIYEVQTPMPGSGPTQDSKSADPEDTKRMPTYNVHNGFIHFKEPVEDMEGSASGSPRAGARRRALSH